MELAPGFTAASVERALKPWREAQDDPDLPEATRAALAVSEAERQLVLYQSRALRRMTIPGDPSLGRLIEAELSRGLELDAYAEDRLRRATPLLSHELSRALESALQGATATVDVDEENERTVEATTTAATELHENELARHTDTLDAIRGLELRYSEFDAAFAHARERTLLDEGRGRRLLAVFRESNELVRAIRDRLETLVSVRRTHAQETRQLTVEPRDADERAINTGGELDALMTLEKQVLELRRDVTEWVRERVTSQEFVDELEGAPLWLEHEWDVDVRWLRMVPRRVTDFDSIGRLLRLSFDLLVLALVWLFVRNQAAGWLRRGIDATRKKEVSRYGFFRRPQPIAARELETVAHYATDAVGAFVLHRLLLPRTETLALLTLVWVGWALLKCVPVAIRLLLPLLGRVLDPLEADNELPADVLALGERTSNWFLRWWILSRIAAFIAVPLLQADRLLQLVTSLSWAIFLLLFVIALALWTPWVRHFIANLADQSSITAWLSRPVRSKLRRLARSAIGAVYILLRLVFWALVDRGWLSGSGRSIALSQLELADASAVLLSPDDRERIRATETHCIERTQELDTLRKAFQGWLRERRSGIVIVIGDNGMGKSVFLDQAASVLESAASDIEVTKLTLPVRQRSDSLREQLAWLTDPLAIKIPDKANQSTLQKTIVEHLESLPPRVFLVDDLHFLLRRTVGGFDVLALARNIIQACADEHFWVLTLHRPAWIYIDGVSSAMKLASRERIELPPLDADELGETLVDRARATGFDPEFRSLLKGRRPHADTEKLEHKARRLYWRLVSQASLGNPRVVADFWLASLGEANGDAPDANGDRKPLPVYLFAGHGDDEVERMSDEYLFLLSALVVHDGLKVEDLSDVLNVTRSKVRVACQHLESLGLINCIERRCLVTTQWQPTVARVLGRRNLANR